MTTLKPEILTVLIDSREQCGYSLAPMKTEVVTLATGDYSICGLQDLVCLERKTLPDFLACCGPERRRFKAELHRMMAYKYRSVIIEGSHADIFHHRYRSRIESASVIGSIASWSGKYGVHFHLAGDRPGGEDFAIRFLMNAARNEWERLESFRKAIDGEVAE